MLSTHLDMVMLLYICTEKWISIPNLKPEHDRFYSLFLDTLFIPNAKIIFHSTQMWLHHKTSSLLVNFRSCQKFCQSSCFTHVSLWDIYGDWSKHYTNIMLQLLLHEWEHTGTVGFCSKWEYYVNEGRFLISHIVDSHSGPPTAIALRLYAS